MFHLAKAFKVPAVSIQGIVPRLRLWCGLMAFLVGLGIVFRCANLEQSVYWVDEVATSMRVAGYTQAEVTQRLATGLALRPDELLQFQQIRPDRPITDLWRVLSQSPEHAPLYFGLVRLWAEVFSSSVIAMRSFSVGLSLLALPVMYGIGRDLFRFSTQTPEIGRVMAWTATGLLASSPFFVAYSQEARPYSLWVLLLLVETWLLWRSLHSNPAKLWLGYGVTLALTLYTSLLTLLVLLGQAVAVWGLGRQRWRYGLATIAALVAFLPWLWVVVTQWQTLQDNTTWMQEPMPLWAMAGVWFYSLAVLFFDVPVAAGMPAILALQMGVAIATVAVIGYATVYLVRRTPPAVGWFLLLGAISTPLVLLSLDLIRGGQASATSRYLMPTQLAALLAVAYWIGDRLLRPSRRGSMAIALLLTMSLMSCLLGLNATSHYQKSRNLSNPAIVALINQARSPQVIAEADQIQDLISLSYGLDSGTRLYIVPTLDGVAETVSRAQQGDRSPFLFNPSDAMKQLVQNNIRGQLQPVFKPKKLIEGELGLTLWAIKETS